MIRKIGAVTGQVTEVEGKGIEKTAQVEQDWFPWRAEDEEALLEEDKN